MSHGQVWKVKVSPCVAALWEVKPISFGPPSAPLMNSTSFYLKKTKTKKKKASFGRERRIGFHLPGFLSPFASRLLSESIKLSFWEPGVYKLPF